MQLSKGALISLGEVATDRILRRYCRGKPFLIHKDVSLRQVIDASRDELSPGEWLYYTKAVFDFVICKDNETQSYELIIEYDGRHHEQPEQALKDQLKDRLCQNVDLPILRIGIEDIKPREKTNILEFVLEQYFGEKTISALREQGRLSQEEEYFSEFQATVNMRQKLMKAGLYPPVVYLSLCNAGRESEAENVYWYQILEKDVTPRANAEVARTFWTADVTVNVIKGRDIQRAVFSILRQARVRDCNLHYNVRGVHGWHIALELAKYHCFKALEAKWTAYSRNM